MVRAKTPSFILELPLVVAPGDERILLARFEAARRIYNALLGEALRRQRIMREAKRLVFLSRYREARTRLSE